MSIFNDKALKGVAAEVAKIMAETSHGSHPKTDKEKSLAALAHPKDKITHKDVLVGRGVIKKEEVEQLDEVGDTPAGRKALGSYVTKAIADKTKDRTKGLRKATSRMYKDDYYGKKTNEEVELDEAKKPMSKDEKNKVVGAVQAAMRKSYDNQMKGRAALAAAKAEAARLAGKKTNEEVELDEAFPTVADAKKRMDAGKTATGSITKTATGLVHKRDYKDDDDEDDTPKKKGGYGARQNYKRSTRVNESASFTEMLELYNEHGLKVLAPIEVEEEQIGDNTIEVIDADKVNGVVETIVEEPTNDEFTKEYEDQKASFEGKKKQPKVAAGKTTGVKVMPEEVEQIDERELTKGESKKKEDYVMGMKKKLSGFKQRYGERAKSVMYATATKMAKKD